MELLINEMLKKGANRKFLKAKAFGGGNVINSLSESVGNTNCIFIQEFLSMEKIPLVSSDLGGKTGRSIWFSYDYSIYQKKLNLF